MTFITFADFIPFSSCILPSAVFFYSFSWSGLIYLPGNFATASPSNHLPSTYRWDVFLLQCCKTLVGTRWLLHNKHRQQTLYNLLPFLGLFFFSIFLLRLHATTHTRQTFGSNGLYPKTQETGSEVRKKDAENKSQKDWTVFLFLTWRFPFSLSLSLFFCDQLL